MKRWLFLILLVCVPVVSHSQWSWDSIPYNNTLKVNPAALFHPTLFYEHTFTKHSAIEVAVGGCVKSGLRIHPANILCASLTYRYYLAYWWQHMMPFLQGGVVFAGAYGSYDVFTGNNGWDIQTRPYQLSEQIVAPTLGYGFRFTTGTHLMVEFSASIALGKHWHQDSENSIIDDIKSIAILTQICGIKLGWAF